MADGLDPGFILPFYTPSDRHLHPELGIDSWEAMPLLSCRCIVPEVRDSPCREIARVIDRSCLLVSQSEDIAHLPTLRMSGSDKGHREIKVKCRCGGCCSTASDDWTTV